MLDHVSVLCEVPAASAAFYDAVLATVGGGRVLDFGAVIGYGIGGKPGFLRWPAQHVARGSASPTWPSRRPAASAVRDFFAAAVGTGAEVLHQTRVWPEYHASYYAAFVRDPDGNNVEAVCHLPED